MNRRSGTTPTMNLGRTRRLEIKHRFRDTCVLCLRGGERVEVHRIVPSLGYRDDNVVLLDRNCHELVKMKPHMQRVFPLLRDLLERAIGRSEQWDASLRDLWTPEKWLKCRRVISGRDHILGHASFEQLFTRLPVSERESLKGIALWLDDMLVWRRTCGAIRAHLSTMPLRNAKGYLERRLRADADDSDPRYLRVMRLLARVKTMKQLKDLLRNEILRLDDYLFVLEHEEKAVGLIYFHYYYKHRYAFVSYVLLSKEPSLLVANHPRRHVALDALVKYGLLQALAKGHPECRGVVAEIDPGEVTQSSSVGADRQGIGPRIALFRLFRRQFPGLKRIAGLTYLQPKSVNDSTRVETPLWLLLYPMPPGTRRTSVSRRELERILDFVYCRIYADELDNLDEEFVAGDFLRYEKYLAALKRRVLASAPARAPLL